MEERVHDIFKMENAERFLEMIREYIENNF